MGNRETLKDLEVAVAQVRHDWRAWYEATLERVGREELASLQGLRLAAWAQPVGYVRDCEGGFGRSEVLRRPDRLLQWGGDCDDWNLSYFGNLMWWWREGLSREGRRAVQMGSVYLPDGESPRHVVFRVAGELDRVWDLTAPGLRSVSRPWDGRGRFVAWEPE